MIKVLVNGAFGRMGSEVVRMVTANPELELIGGYPYTDSCCSGFHLSFVIFLRPDRRT